MGVNRTLKISICICTCYVCIELQTPAGMKARGSIRTIFGDLQTTTHIIDITRLHLNILSNTTTPCLILITQLER